MADAREAFEVHLDDVQLGPIRQVGTLHAPAGGRADLPASFAYDSGWLGSRSAFALDPQLVLGRGEQYPARADGFGIFLDSAPDRWRRVLMQRREALAARRHARVRPSRHEPSRAGRHRQAHRGARHRGLPEYERWLAAIIAPGSSLGGARPKANFRGRDGTLRIAKFPAKDDTHDVGGWGHVVHRLARDAGIDVPESEALRLSD